MSFAPTTLTLAPMDLTTITSWLTARKSPALAGSYRRQHRPYVALNCPYRRLQATILLFTTVAESHLAVALPTGPAL